MLFSVCDRKILSKFCADSSEIPRLADLAAVRVASWSLFQLSTLQLEIHTKPPGTSRQNGGLIQGGPRLRSHRVERPESLEKPVTKSFSLVCRRGNCGLIIGFVGVMEYRQIFAPKNDIFRRVLTFLVN